MIEWRGDDVVDKVTKATALGVDQVLADCVNHSKREHPFTNRSAKLEGSIRLEPAKVEGVRVVGRWGSWQIAYAIYVETMEKFSYLRPSADLYYTTLPARVKANLKEMME